MSHASGFMPRYDQEYMTGQNAAPQNHSRHVVECGHGVVVSVSEAASEAGLFILKNGGNAVDDAIATAFALQAAYPLSGGVGGGGFMLVHPAHGQGDPISIDYRETAPAAAWPTMYTPEESQYTHRAVATPGTVRGLELAHRRFGTLSWPQLIQPAIALARDGFSLDAYIANSLNITLEAAPEHLEFQRVFKKPGSGTWEAGDRLIQPDLARTLEVLADLGPDAFYSGPIAAEIAAEMARGKGYVTAADLAGYRALERKPLSARYRGAYDIYVPPPPCAGGMCLIEELHVLDTFDLKAWGRWSPRTLHVMAEAMRRANCDRARYLGDSAFVEIPRMLATHEYGHELAKSIDVDRATPSTDLNSGITTGLDDENTTHFSVIDQQGMGVANTFTLERRWGSRVVVKDTGLLLNNDMRAFELFPGRTDTKGNMGTAPNVIAPGKRPLSSQTPTVVARDGRVKLITGSPGSQSIPHTILCILVSALDFNLPIQEAVESSRLSHQWFPDEISFENLERYPEILKALSEMGHRVVRPEPPFQGDAHTIWVEGQHNYIGVADRRISGKASGY